MGNHTMSVSGKIIREVAEDIFEVKTRLGTALIWFDEELYLKPVVGCEFEVFDGPVTFWDGYVVSNITKNVSFHLDGRHYKITGQ